MRDLATPIACALALAASATLGALAPESTWAPQPVAPPPRPSRIVSLTLPADEIVLALVSPDRVLALEAYVDDAQASNVVADARAVRGRMHQPITAEAVIAARPDLVLLSGWSDPQLEALLGVQGVPVERVISAQSLEGTRAQITRIGALLDEPQRAREVIAAMDARIDVVRAHGAARRSRPRVLLFSWSGHTPAEGTLFCELAVLAGATCASTEAGLSGYAPLTIEHLLELDPDVIVTNRYRADGRARAVVPEPALEDDPRLRTLRAVREDRVIALPSAHLLATSHHVASLAEDLSRALDALEPPR
ncbi:ABC transporter substrate-binding protein [Sandaracinus amylolyticus]|uniref:ABC transporter substrate-binding protein n=1 Tax=Sandaracinus amylolyticus TaxID=927083 RepID=UPI001F194BE0|nr:ABC transporter substrate-binding protein [Sandaracinus amylolyticus]UJR81574.1 Vitamin B12 ABC transporter, B12-binding component BtuF [Sandaracinus amylolyticus]